MGSQPGERTGSLVVIIQSVNDSDFGAFLPRAEKLLATVHVSYSMSSPSLVP